MQVDLIKPTVKAHQTKRLELKCDDPLSSSGFNLNLRRHNKEDGALKVLEPEVLGSMVGRCRLSLSNPS